VLQRVGLTFSNSKLYDSGDEFNMVVGWGFRIWEIKIKRWNWKL